MKSIKCALSMLICFCMIFSFCGCSLIIDKIRVETKDKNGEDDYSLAVLTEDDICVEKNVCYCVVFGLNPSGSKTYTDEEYWHDADFIEAAAYSPLSGVSLLQSTYGTADTITLTVVCDRTKGNVRIVLLDENLEIIHDFNITERSSYTVSNAKARDFEIRVAGESAEFTVNVSRAFSDK